jgi:hypothetical protein
MDSKIEIINRKHPKILELSKSRGSVYVSIIEDKEMYFTSRAAVELDLKVDKYLHFMNDGQEWKFYQNDNPDGFPLTADSTANSYAVKVSSRGLIQMFRKSTGFTDKRVRLLLHHTDQIVNGCKVIEIDTRKSYDEILNNSK